MEWRVYKIWIKIRKPVVGAIPKNPYVLESWIVSRARRKGMSEEEIAKLVDKVKEEVQADEGADRNYVTFKRDRYGIYLEDRNFKAMLREAFSVLGYFTGRGSAARKQVFQHALAVKPAKVRFLKPKEDAPWPEVKRYLRVQREPDDQQQRTLHVMTPQGPRDTIRVEDVVKPPAYMCFSVWIPETPLTANTFTEEDFREALKFAGDTIGIGASRSQQFGKFKFLELAEYKFSV